MEAHPRRSCREKRMHRRLLPGARRRPGGDRRRRAGGRRGRGRAGRSDRRRHAGARRRRRRPSRGDRRRRAVGRRGLGAVGVARADAGGAGGRDADGDQLSVLLPTTIVAPGRRAVGRPAHTPSTRVPLPEPRSSTVTMPGRPCAGPATATRQCLRDTPGSFNGRSESAARPRTWTPGVRCHTCPRAGPPSTCRVPAGSGRGFVPGPPDIPAGKARSACVVIGGLRSCVARSARHPPKRGARPG